MRLTVLLMPVMRLILKRPPRRSLADRAV